MRVEGTNGAQQEGLPAGKPAGAVPPRPRPTDVRPAADSTQVNPAEPSHTQKALAAQEVDLAAVAEARRLLQEGKLDTPEAARRAAEILIDRGP